MSKENDKLVLSLLEGESRGGDHNESGITFQAEVVLSHVPRWLAMEGFTSMLREGMGDAEAKFFMPGHGYKKEFIEVKNHPVTPAEFWVEIDRFKEMDAGSPDEYQWFTLASAGLSRELHPLVNSLRRIRGPYGFYDEGSVIMDNSYKGYVQAVVKLDKTEEDAKFLYQKVLLQDNLGIHSSQGQAMFIQAMSDHLPAYRDLPIHILSNVYIRVASFVQSRRNQTIKRTELEEKLRESIPYSLQPPVTPVRIHTLIRDSDEGVDPTTLHFAWALFFGGEERDYPLNSIWNEQLIGQLQETKNWILKHRKINRIILSGNRRLSASLAFGSIFPAVAGFSIEMLDRDIPWASDAHPTNDTPAYPLNITPPSEGITGERLVVSIGIIRDIVSAVEADLEWHDLGKMPLLHIRGIDPIESAQQANLAVRGIKNHISKSLAHTGAQQIDLFLAGPAFLALLLGHRLNATTTVQCYEQLASGHYKPTCRLFGLGHTNTT